jgi:hypothetical protein
LLLKFVLNICSVGVSASERVPFEDRRQDYIVHYANLVLFVVLVVSVVVVVSVVAVSKFCNVEAHFA